MGRSEFLSTFDQLLLMALLRLGQNAYGRTVFEEIEKRVKGNLALGQVYMALARLEESGFVKSELGGVVTVRGGRSKRFFRITGLGERALRDSLRSVDQMRDDLVASGLAYER